MIPSALINVMVKAARRAGRSLKRDLGEIENLQVSLKAPPTSSAMPTSARKRCCTPTCPRRGRATASSARKAACAKAPTRAIPGSSIRSTARTNFLHGIPQFAISIGPQRDDVLIAGVIYNPANDELYIAERGKGAFLNDQRLRGRRPQATA